MAQGERRMAGMKEETKDEGVGSLLEQLRARDERIAALSRELEERSGRLARERRRRTGAVMPESPARVNPPAIRSGRRPCGYAM